MVSISLCMIVKDEEAVLARCLDSVQGIADEIIIVDTGSSDQTRAIASQYGRVLDFACARMFLLRAIIRSRRRAAIISCGWTRTM